MCPFNSAASASAAIALLETIASQSTVSIQQRRGGLRGRAGEVGTVPDEYCAINTAAAAAAAPHAAAGAFANAVGPFNSAAAATAARKACSCSSPRLTVSIQQRRVGHRGATAAAGDAGAISVHSTAPRRPPRLRIDGDRVIADLVSIQQRRVGLRGRKALYRRLGAGYVSIQQRRVGLRGRYRQRPGAAPTSSVHSTAPRRPPRLKMPPELSGAAAGCPFNSAASASAAAAKRADMEDIQPCPFNRAASASAAISFSPLSSQSLGVHSTAPRRPPRPQARARECLANAVSIQQRRVGLRGTHIKVSSTTPAMCPFNSAASASAASSPRNLTAFGHSVSIQQRRVGLRGANLLAVCGVCHGVHSTAPRRPPRRRKGGREVQGGGVSIQQAPRRPPRRRNVSTNPLRTGVSIQEGRVGLRGAPSRPTKCNPCVSIQQRRVGLRGVTYVDTGNGRMWCPFNSAASASAADPELVAPPRRQGVHSTAPRRPPRRSRDQLRRSRNAVCPFNSAASASAAREGDAVGCLC